MTELINEQISKSLIGLLLKEENTEIVFPKEKSDFGKDKGIAL